jgi:hypothetical protein
LLKTTNWVNGILIAMVLLGIGLVGLSVALDTVVASHTKWVWIAVAGFGLSFTGVGLMKD